MEITEKLNIFYLSAIEAADRQSSDDLEEFKNSMEKIQQEYRQNKKMEIASRYQIEEGKLKRDINHRISEAVTEQKRQLNIHQQEKKKALFAVVEGMLKEYQKTEGYQRYLAEKIRMASRFARGQEIVIYLNPTDADKKEPLERETGCALTVSNIDFGGGIRAVVRSKNVLIDESFLTKLNQEREAYTF